MHVAQKRRKRQKVGVLCPQQASLRLMAASAGVSVSPGQDEVIEAKLPEAARAAVHYPDRYAPSGMGTELADNVYEYLDTVKAYGGPLALEVFFTVHDPTQLNRQGNDIGTQYRSAIYYVDEDQKIPAERIKEDFQKYFNDEIVTEITELSNYHEAEEYHHNYFELNPGNGYCQMVVAPKLAKVRHKMSHLY